MIKSDKFHLGIEMNLLIIFFLAIKKTLHIKIIDGEPLLVSINKYGKAILVRGFSMM